MIRTVSDIFPIAGGAAGAVGGIIKDSANMPITFKSVLVYIGLTILGALAGYFVKALLDTFNMQGRFKDLLKKPNKKSKRKKN